MSSPNQYQTQECILFGSVLDEHRDYLLQRLKGLADPGSVEFSEHEMIFCLRTGASPDVIVRLRRKMDATGRSAVWHFRYIGTPEPDLKCPTVVRKIVDSLVHSNNMMEFVKAMGLRHKFEYTTQGLMFTKGRIKILVAKLNKIEEAGNYHPKNLKPVSASNLVEISMSIPDGEPYLDAAKTIRDFADQLKPICIMGKDDMNR